MVKVKHARTADCVVAGFRWHKNGPGELVGSLLLGLYDDGGRLHHVGVTSSFTTADAPRSSPRSSSPCARTRWPSIPGGNGRRWPRAAPTRMPGGQSRWSQGKDLSWEPLRIERVCEVKYDHLQGDRFRHATTFQRWRAGQAARGLPLRPARGHAAGRAGGDLRRMTRRGRRCAPGRARSARRLARACTACAAEWTPARDARGPPSTTKKARSPAAQAARFSALVDKGIADIESYLRPAAPDGLREGRIVYHVGADAALFDDARPQRVPDGRARAVGLRPLSPRDRPRAGPVAAPLRLAQRGFASYVESYVSENIGGYDAHVFSKTGNRGVDGEAARWLSREAGQRRAPLRRRARRAAGDAGGAAARGRAVLRACPSRSRSSSCSGSGLGPVISARLLARPGGAPWLRVSGRTVEDWKAEWLKTLPAGAV